MKKIALPIVLSIALTAGCASQSPQRPVDKPNPASSAQTQDDVAAAANPVAVPIPVSLGLTVAAREAVQTLANAPAFGGEAVGYAGQPVAAVAALRALLAEPQAAAALTLVLEHGTLPAQLLALSGMYYADQAMFRERLESYRAVDESVPVYLGGCFVGFEQQPVSALLQAPGAVQMRGPSESWQQWAKRNPGSKTLVFDIEGGGYPMSLAGR
jgi:hypothetical protein